MNIVPQSRLYIRARSLPAEDSLNHIIHQKEKEKERRIQLTQTNNINNQNPMLKRHKLKIDSLHSRPKHPILLQCLPISAPQLLLRITPLHVRHRAEKAEEIGGGEDGLVGQDARGDGEVGARGEIYAAGEEGEPGCCYGAEEAWWGLEGSGIDGERGRTAAV